MPGFHIKKQFVAGFKPRNISRDRELYLAAPALAACSILLLVYMCWKHVTGLIHGAAARADTSYIYLESFSFSLFSVP